MKWIDALAFACHELLERAKPGHAGHRSEQVVEVQPTRLNAIIAVVRLAREAADSGYLKAKVTSDASGLQERLDDALAEMDRVP
jgi:hypothetical protein